LWKDSKENMSGLNTTLNSDRREALYVTSFPPQRYRRPALAAQALSLLGPSLDLSRVENIVVEVHYRYGSRESQEIIRALAKHGFKIVPLYPDQTSRSHRLLACKGEVPW